MPSNFSKQMEIVCFFFFVETMKIDRAINTQNILGKFVMEIFHVLFICCCSSWNDVIVLTKNSSNSTEMRQFNCWRISWMVFFGSLCFVQFLCFLHWSSSFGRRKLSAKIVAPIVSVCSSGLTGCSLFASSFYTKTTTTTTYFLKIINKWNNQNYG